MDERLISPDYPERSECPTGTGCVSLRTEVACVLFGQVGQAGRLAACGLEGSCREERIGEYGRRARRDTVDKKLNIHKYRDHRRGIRSAMSGKAATGITLDQEHAPTNGFYKGDDMERMKAGGTEITRDKNNTESTEPDLRGTCLLYTSPSPRDRQKSRMPSSA